MELVGLSNETELTKLVNRIISGDVAAEEVLVRRYKEGISIIIGQIVRNKSVTEDLSQDTFGIIIAKVRQGDLREPERLSGFVNSVARNVAIAYIRRPRRLINDEAIGTIEDIPDSSPNQLEEVLRQEKAAMVRQVINELKKERDRDLLLRYYIAEEDKEKICAELGLTRLQFNSVIFRATERFKNLYIQKIRD